MCIFSKPKWLNLSHYKLKYYDRTVKFFYHNKIDKNEQKEYY